MYAFWRNPKERTLSPLQRVERVVQSFRPTNQLTEADTANLLSIWQVFGWSEDGVHSFIQEYRTRPHQWFAGIRNQQGELVSACMGERLDFAGITMVEGTEYGTLPEYQNHGLCTAAVTLLHAQIIERVMSQAQRLPLITAEFSMSSRSDIVGYQTGMTIPLVEGTHGLDQHPLQVLRYNVSIFDNLTPNTIHGIFGVPPEESAYLRNFILGILPQDAISRYYSQATRQHLLSYLERPDAYTL